MPSSRIPSSIGAGPGKLSANTATATAQLFPSARASGDADVSLKEQRPTVSSDLSTYPDFTSTGDVSRFLSGVGVVWLGDDVNNAISDLFQIVTQDPSVLGSEPVLTSEGSAVEVVSISGASVGDGFVDTTSTPFTLNFNSAILSGVDYRVLFSVPQTLVDTSDLQRNALLRAAGSLGLQGKTEVAAALAGGLDERYRRFTGAVDRTVVTVDTEGAGATINRDGKGVTIELPQTDWVSNRAPDPFLAAYRVEYDDYTLTTATSGAGGDFGIFGLTGHIWNGGANERSSAQALSGVAATFIPRDIRSDALGGGTTRTYIPLGTVATLNATGSDPDRVTLTAPAYFVNGSGLTAVRSGRDLLLITFNDGSQQAYRIVLNFGLADNEAELETLSGEAVNFAAPTPVSEVQWLSAYAVFGGAQYGNGEPSRGVPLGFYDVEPMQDGGAATTSTNAMEFGGRSWGTGVALSAPSTLALYGFFDPETGDLVPTLYVKSDGTIDAYATGPTGQYNTAATGYIKHALAHRHLEAPGSGDVTLDIDPQNKVAEGAPGGNGAGFSSIYHDHADNPAVTYTKTITCTESNLELGMLFDITIRNGTGSTLVMVWPGFFRFSNPADAQWGSANGTANHIIRWRCQYVGSGVVLVDRTDYAP